MKKRCFSCFKETEKNICPYCGNDNNSADSNLNLLPKGAVVKDRFLIGNAVEINGEGITYLAYDLKEEKKIRLREFFPETISKRAKDKKSIAPLQGKELQFKSLMTDFVELSKTLISITANSCLLNALDIFSANSTIYVVYEDVEAITLTKYLLENAGELSWEETENLFLPLLYTVKLLNTNGIVHRGISPETILVTPNNTLKLTGICTSAARAINSEINSEIFMGYAAPEQYQKCANHGEWTDVYSVSAVLYKTLTGTMPPQVESRKEGESIISPRALNSNIPQSVSEAIINGLAYEKAERTMSITELIGNLYSANSHQQAAPHYNSYEEEAEKPKKKKRKFRFPVWLAIVLIVTPLMLFLFFYMYEQILGPINPDDEDTSSNYSEYYSADTSSEDTSSEAFSEEEPAVETVTVPQFIGMNIDDIMAATLYTEMFTFKEPIYMYDDIVPYKEVILQDKQLDEIVELGSEIQLTVCDGPEYLQLPPTTDENGEDISPEGYKKMLEQSGMNVTIETRISEKETESGLIDGFSAGEDDLIDRKTTRDIIIYVAL